MLELLILALTEQPSKETAPLFLALNTPASRTTQGLAEGGIVALCTERTENGIEVQMPYVRVYDDGQKQAVDQSINGMGGYFENEDRFLVIECAAVGSTKFEAAKRAEKLRLVVLGKLYTLFDQIDSETLKITDDGGSGSYYEINKWRLTTGDDPHTKGPGMVDEDDDIDPIYTSIKYVHVSVELSLALMS